MADIVKKILRKIRGTKIPQQKPTISIAQAKAKREQLAKEGWERDKKNNRNAAFKKATLIRGINLEETRKAKEAEEVRQAEIMKARLKNLKKARRAKRRNQNAEI
jgi:hypothetical protein